MRTIPKMSVGTRVRVLVAVLLCITANSGRADDVTFLDQGWDDDTRQQFYYTPQGSELIRYSWFIALEQPDCACLFRDNAYLTSFKFLPNSPNKHNPDGLPVGFVGDATTGKDRWLGLTCAACHTTQFTYRGKTVRVDGGTTLADMIAFQQALVDAVRATVKQEDKFCRFAWRVLGPTATAAQFAELRAELKEGLAGLADWAAHSRPAIATGFGNWDAVNILLNQINGAALGEPANYRTPQVPVSYPSIWRSNQMDKLLWNASVENMTLRSVGEVIIVFGKAKVTATDKGLSMKSTADLRALRSLYETVDGLSSPRWPEHIMGALDPDKLALGAKIYDREGCAACHANKHPYPMTEPNRFGKEFIKVYPTPIGQVGTDPNYAMYFVQRTAKPGIMAPAFKGSPFEKADNLPAAVLFLGTLAHLTMSEVAALGVPESDYPEWLGYRDMPTLPKNEAELNALVQSLLVYKAAPLEGVWSSAPYLHNASVPTLYDLLLPADQRPKTFTLGNREYDAKCVGYQTGDFAGGYRFDTSQRGFSNAGHEYGTKITDEERWALLEYLKSM
ncbi:MAG: di-heme-cytochrome C peroxidase [Planctomycetota bacterium]|nr:di-heme-cytochrome C peroxidase [Planctomycetota bacterium]MDA1164647.1 di-heme-cytochrome C peroxidase [Planctomycetota bacterium]